MSGAACEKLALSRNRLNVGQVAGASFFQHFLAEVVLDVRCQVRGGVRLGVHRRKLAVDQRPLQREVAAGFGRRQRVQVTGARSAAQQVDAPPAQAASARPGQDEAEPVSLDQAMDLVEDQRRSLHFVDHDPPVVSGRDQVPQPLWSGEQLQIQGMVKQIEVERVREPLLEPRRLAGPAGTEQEEALAAVGRDRQGSGVHNPILRRKNGSCNPALTSRARHGWVSRRAYGGGVAADNSRAVSRMRSHAASTCSGRVAGAPTARRSTNQPSSTVWVR